MTRHDPCQLLSVCNTATADVKEEWVSNSDNTQAGQVVWIHSWPLKTALEVKMGMHNFLFWKISSMKFCKTPILIPKTANFCLNTLFLLFGVISRLEFEIPLSQAQAASTVVGTSCFMLKTYILKNFTFHMFPNKMFLHIPKC